MKKIRLFAVALMGLFSMSAIAETVTFSATEMSEQALGIKKGNITVICPTKAGDQQWYKGSSTVKDKAISINSSADTAVIIPASGKSLHFRADANYNITNISIETAANKDSICGEPIVIWTDAIDKFPAYVGTIEVPSRAEKEKPAPVVVANIPEGATAFAVYRRIKYNSSTGEIGTGSNFGRSGQTWNIFNVTITYEAASPSLRSVTIAGVEATIKNDTITAELPYGTTPESALASVAVVYGGSGASYEINPLNGTVIVYNADKSQSKVYQLSITIAQNPSSEKELLEVKINGEEVELVNNAANLVVSSKTDISAVPVEFTLSAAATADFTSGNTHDFANPLVITVTAQDKSTATYTLTVTKAVKSILYIGGNTDDKVANAFEAQNWYVVARSVAKAPQTYEEYDVVVLHESIDGKLAGDTTSEVHTILEKNIPVLNTKTYFYNSGRWGIGTPAGGTAGETAIRLNSGEYGNVANHPLFTGVTATEGMIEMVSQADGKAMQPVADYEDTWTKSILAKVSGGTVIEEGLNGNYLLISIGSGSFQYLTDDALKLFVNAVNYLTSTEKFVLTAPEVKSDKKEITSFKLNGIAGVIDAENHTIAVAYPELLGEITAIEPLIVISEYATITPEGAQDFTKPVEYTVTAQDGTTQVWTVTVTVSQLAQLQKTDMDYTSDMSTWENVPEWIFIKDGALNKAYAGNDYTGSAIRINKDGEVYFGLAVCSKITVTVSATGGRTFKLEVVGDDTKVVTKEGKSNTNYPLELVVNSESPVTVKLSTPGANGGATVQKIEVMYVEGGIGTALEDIQALDVNAPMYNVLGVEVDKAYKGIVIQNGKKYLLK